MNDHLDPRCGPRAISTTVIWAGFEFVVAFIVFIVLMLIGK